jgi:acetyltransferase (GNAT) family protein
MALERRVAGRADDGEFAAFGCWNGDPGQPWAAEVENYVRGTLLRQPDTRILAFREEGELVAVSAYYKRTIGVPALNPTEHDAWHLEVVAIRLDRQGEGLSHEVIEQTLRAMREEDPGRVLVTAVAHRDNIGAFAACAHFDLLQYVQQDPDYWVLVGELPSD